MGRRGLELGQSVAQSWVRQPGPQSGPDHEHRGVLSWATPETAATSVTVNSSDIAVYPADQKMRGLDWKDYARR